MRDVESDSLICQYRLRVHSTEKCLAPASSLVTPSYDNTGLYGSFMAAFR